MKVQKLRLVASFEEVMPCGSEIGRFMVVNCGDKAETVHPVVQAVDDLCGNFVWGGRRGGGCVLRERSGWCG